MVAELNDSPTFDNVWQAMPIEASVNGWDDEIYFEIRVTDEQTSDRRTDMEIGEIGYWSLGRAIVFSIAQRR
jgi:hypothetical protein